jgi:hypothetical protein
MRARMSGSGVRCRLLSCAAASCSVLGLEQVLVLPCGDELPVLPAAAADMHLPV